MKNISFSIVASTSLIASSYLHNESFAQKNLSDNSIVNKEDIQEKLSRKYILPSDEDIEKMSEEQLLEEIKNYDSDIIDMMTNIEVVNSQIDTLENQIKLIEREREFYLRKGQKLEKESETRDANLNKIKAFLNLPSISLTEHKEKELLVVFDKIEEGKDKSKKINSNITYLDLNSKYKEDYLIEVQNMKKFLDKESLKVADTKSKVNLRIEELNRRESIGNNPYGSQGDNVSIPENSSASELIRQIIDITAQQIGVPYVWGGTTPKGFDCSGLMQYAFGKAGVHIPRVARDQQKVSTKISFEDLKPGDLVFWNSPATHVAIYIGEGKIIESPRTGLNVRSRFIKSTEKGINFGRILH